MFFSISIKNQCGAPQYILLYNMGGENAQIVTLPPGKWNRNLIIDALVRIKYSQDEVEAILSNHMSNLVEYVVTMNEMGSKVAKQKFADLKASPHCKEYEEFQQWREQCKKWADELLEQYPAI